MTEEVQLTLVKPHGTDYLLQGNRGLVTQGPPSSAAVPGSRSVYLRFLSSCRRLSQLQAFSHCTVMYLVRWQMQAGNSGSFPANALFGSKSFLEALSSEPDLGPSPGIQHIHFSPTLRE